MATDYVMPYDLTVQDLRTMDDSTLLAHEDHYGAVLASCQAEREAQLELLSLIETTASDAAQSWLTNLAERTDRQAATWLRALQMTCTERKRRDEEAQQDAHNVSLLYNAAELLSAHGLHVSALQCNELAQAIANNDPFTAPAAEATASARPCTCDGSGICGRCQDCADELWNAQVDNDRRVHEKLDAEATAGAGL